MLNKIYFALVATLFIWSNLLLGQTSQWKLIWNKNVPEDSVEYYVVYRNENAQPTSSDSVGMKLQPVDINVDSVVYIDTEISPGIHYYYSVVAVKNPALRSTFSGTADAAIPEITFGTLALPVDTTQSLDTIIIDLENSDYVNDPDHNLNVSWEVSGGSQISALVDAQNRVTFITPANNLDLQEIFEFSVTDPDGFTDLRPVVVSLTPIETTTNRIPEINTTPPRRIEVGENYEYNITASDPDGDNLTFTLTEAPLFLDLNQINNTSAVISGIPGSADAGKSYRITIVVSDGHGGITEQSYFLRVESLPVSPDLISFFSLTNIGSSIVQLNWTTIEPTKDHVLYGQNTGYGSSTLEDVEYTTEHQAILRSLFPETEYHFSIISRKVNGEISNRPDDTFLTSSGIEVEVFPIPFVASEAQGNENITFVNLPEGSTIVVYNLMAEPVFRVSDITHVFNWDVKNNSGKNISAGVYIYYVKDTNDKKLTSGKLIIIR